MNRFLPLLLAGATASLAAQEPGLVARYTFTDAASLGRDVSGNGHHAVVTTPRSIRGPDGNALEFGGDGGMVIPAAPDLHAGNGFTIALWVRWADVSRSVTLAVKKDEYLLRLDPPAEGGNLSFFVNAGGTLEPRVRGPRPRTGKWCHVVAAWDGAVASLWVDGRRYSQQRRGLLKTTDNPIQVGTASTYGPAGFRGALADVQFYNRARAEGEILAAEYGLRKPAPGPRVTAHRFEFTTGLEGWSAVNAPPPSIRRGSVRLSVSGSRSAFRLCNLKVPVADLRYFSCRFSASAGKRALIVFRTTAGEAAEDLPVKADGRMHSYVVRMDAIPEWDGVLEALALVPSDEAGEIVLDCLRFGPSPAVPPELHIRNLLLDAAVNRVGRPCLLTATLFNSGGDAHHLTARLRLPSGVELVSGRNQRIPPLPFRTSVPLVWRVQAARKGTYRAQLTAAGDGSTEATATLDMRFTEPVPKTVAPYVPAPRPVATQVLVGCHYCPLWKQGTRSGGWEQIVPFPNRKPALGWYDEGNPEVADWEIKWCLEHGISFFVYCWYRQGQGGPVHPYLGHALHQGLFHSRYGDRFKFCLMWENQRRGIAGVSSEADFLENLLPYWIDTYFRRSNYLRIDNKPLLFIYRPEYLADDLGSVENVRQALDKARDLCRKAGFAGLTILGEYRGVQAEPLRLMRREGVDYAFQYCWPVLHDPTPAQAIRTQMDDWRAWRKLNEIPYLLTVSMGWDSTPWHPTYTKWRLPPADFRTLCRRADEERKKLPADSLGRRIVLLDNWNEFGEGHYLAPHRQYGFGYLDAVRDVFSSAPSAHVDLVPEDVGRGPYDSLFREELAVEARCSRRVAAPGAAHEPGLVAWWTFDDDDSRVTFDYSGNGLGGRLRNARRVPGYRGRALECTGGCVTVAADERLQPARGLSLSCRLKTNTPDQEDAWFVNCEFGDGSTGYRFGVKDGKLCFAVPKTPWSHHLVAAEPLPLNRWVHALATWNGRLLRIYMDGRLVGSLPRTGRLNPAHAPLVLGNYAPNHRAHFTGLLDEVKVYDRAIAPPK